jgi:hypothetical protein
MIDVLQSYAKSITNEPKLLMWHSILSNDEFTL